MRNHLLGDIQKAIISAINNLNFHFDLPNLSKASWEPLGPLLSSSNSTAHERDRLEFVGDGLLHAVIGIELYKLFPLESPHFYTTLRSSLNSNATFAHLMVKVGAHKLSSLNNKNKKAADAFEMCVAVYHMEHDFETLCLWVGNRFRPLMLAAASVFDNFRQWEASSSRPSSAKHSRKVRPKMANVAFYTKSQKPKKHKTLARYNFKQQKRQRLLRQRCSRTPTTAARVPTTPLAILFAPRPKNHDPLPPAQLASVANLKTIIDLTLDSDSEEQTEEDHEGEPIRSTDDLLTAEPPSIYARPTSTADSFQILRRFVRTHRAPPPGSLWLPPMTKPIDKSLVTLNTPTHAGIAPTGSDQVAGTFTNPITIDDSDG